MHTLKSVKNVLARSAQILLVVAIGVPDAIAQVPSAAGPSIFGVFVGTSPSGESIRQLLQIPSDPEPEVIQWKLTLHQDPGTLAPARYELRFDYGLTTPGEPGLARGIKTMQRQGSWTKSKGTKSNSGATVFDLRGALSLLQVDDNILHVLEPDRSLMIGNGGWSYSLNRADRAEKPVPTGLASNEPDMSYPILPLATGSKVFAVFEGRSPCAGIAGHLKIPVHAACLKAKWRVTLYQDPETLAPTTYRVEGTFYRRSPLAGNWARIRGHENDAGKAVYRLEPRGKGTALDLLEGDANVLFFLDRNRRPFVGNVHFSYTLNRRNGTS